MFGNYKSHTNVFAGLLLYSVSWACLALPVSRIECPQFLELEKRIIGKAYALEHGGLQYTELHYESPNAGYRKVNYVDADNTIIASKAVDYRASKVAPEYVQIDWRSGKIKTRYTDDGYTFTGITKMADVDQSRAVNTSSLWYCEDDWILHSAKSLQSVSTSDGGLSSPTVVDAGFDHFIREQWPSLLNDESISFGFALPARKKPVRMSVVKKPLMHCAEKLQAATSSNNTLQLVDNNAVCFEMRASNWLLNQLVKPIYLVYGLQDKLLYYFHGLADISSDAEKSQRLLISYRYL